MVTWDVGAPLNEEIDNVRVLKVCGQNAGLPGFRVLHPKWTSLNRALRAADADVYYHHGAEGFTGQIAMWCVRNRRKFVFYSASDTDCDPQLPLLPAFWERSLYRYGLRHADALITQTESQRNQLKEGFGLDSVVLPYPCPDTAQLASAAQSGVPHKRVLWIARGCIQKRPDLLLDLAESCPDITFDLAGPFYTDDYAQKVLRRAHQIGNVIVHGAVSRDRVAEFFQRAACMCCTSDYEGFPNTFLEAWSFGLPIVSTFDPDSSIERRELGMVAKTVPELRLALQSLLSSPGVYRKLSANARQYFLQNHTFDAVLPRYEEVFKNVMNAPASPAVLA